MQANAVAIGMAMTTWCAAVAGLPPRFIEDTVVSGLDNPIGCVFDTNGRMFYWEQAGKVWYLEDGDKVLLLDISAEVASLSDQGLLGFELDPDYLTNGYVYLFYLVDWAYLEANAPDGHPQGVTAFPSPDQMTDTIGRLTRYTIFNPDTSPAVDLASWKILIGRWTKVDGDPSVYSHDGIASTSRSHGPGSLHFAPDGTLLAGVGDGACWATCGSGLPDIGQGGCPSFCGQDGTAEAKNILRDAEKVGAFRAQLINSFNGKILRMDVRNIDDDLGVPGLPSNPFYDSAAPYSPASIVWTLGLRNPYQFTLRPGTGSSDPAVGNPGSLYIGNVGVSTWEEMEIVTGPGVNLGWPLFEGLTPSSGFPGTQVANLDAPNPLFDGLGCNQEHFHFTDLLAPDSTFPPSWPNPCDPLQAIPSAFTFQHHSAVLDWRHGIDSARVPAYDQSGNVVAVQIDAPESTVSGQSFNGRCSIGGTFSVGNTFPCPYRNTYFFADCIGAGGAAGWIYNAVTVGDSLVEVRSFRDPDMLPTATPVSLGTDPMGRLVWVHHSASGGEIRRISFDCNGNGVLDELDISQGASLDQNADGIPDECEVGDLDCDGQIDTADVGAFALALVNPSQYEALYPDCYLSRADVDFSGQRDGLDIDGFVSLILAPQQCP